MKPTAFDYVRPDTLPEAISILAGEPDAKILAGGQTLGPLLNLRLTQPRLIVDITRVADLTRYEASTDGVILGACITHANIEDGRIDDPSGGFLRRMASGIAYRAVRNRGTIGGSLAHGDPAADWISGLIALGAEALITGPAGQRRLGIFDLVRGALDVAIDHDEVLDGVFVPRLSRSTRTGYHKICRKTGEFADAIAVVLEDNDRDLLRCVFGATEGRPIVVEDARQLLTRDSSGIDRAATREHLIQVASPALGNDSYHLNILVAALERAYAQALSAGRAT